jgi:lysozyme family protein
MADYAVAYRATCDNEGGYTLTTDPTDAGGMTFGGISRRFFPNWPGWAIIDSSGVNTQSLVTLKPMHASLFKLEFWDRFYGDQIIDQNLANKLFDAGINVGISTVISWLQRALNVANDRQVLWKDIAVDGACGISTLAVIDTARKAGRSELVIQIIDVLQGAHYVTIAEHDESQEKYILGWINKRVFT